jgi:hypothetical protein
MITKDSYIKETEHAVRKMIEVFKTYSDLTISTFSPFEVFRRSNEEELETKTIEWQEKAEIIEKQKKADIAKGILKSRMFSREVISGAILQIACKAIESYSENTEIHSRYNYLFDSWTVEDERERAKNNNCKYCVGRDIRKVPQGLIILAARNQYNHFNEERLKTKINNVVFDALAENRNSNLDKGFTFDTLTPKGKDPAFDLTTRNLDCYSSNVLNLMDWDNYDNYLRDIKGLL